jgi:hypothetical protein
MTGSGHPPEFPRAAGLLFGLGGCFDGIVLHQLLQWHHKLSSWYLITTMKSLKPNTFSEGLPFGDLPFRLGRALHPLAFNTPEALPVVDKGACWTDVSRVRAVQPSSMGLPIIRFW